KAPLWALPIADGAQACAKRNVVQAALKCSHWMTNAAAYFANENPSRSAAAWKGYVHAREVEKQRHVSVLHDLFGDPFPAVATDLGNLRWHRGAVVTLAGSIYARTEFQRMGELAQLLERAGCADEKVLAHCRGPGRHFRGCWLVDSLLGKHEPLDPAPKR